MYAKELQIHIDRCIFHTNSRSTATPDLLRDLRMLLLHHSMKQEPSHVHIHP